MSVLRDVQEHYCSRDCQKADWNSHKKICGKQPSQSEGPSGSSGSFEASTALSPPKGLTQPIAKPFTRLDSGTWLHSRPEKDVYTLLIDVYRMHIEDMYKFDGDADEDSIYGGRQNSVKGFTRFLTLIEDEKRSLLPDWWSDTKKRDCIAYGMRGARQWASLETAIEKSDVLEHYGEPRFPMQLRLFAETVYGRGPGGSDGTMTRRMMMLAESDGDSFVSTMDTASGNRTFS